MKCQSSPPSSKGLSAKQVDRFFLLRERFLRISVPCTTSTGPVPPSPAGSTPRGANGSTSNLTGTKTAPTGGLSDSLFERLAALALTPPSEDGPPIRTCTVRTGVDGTEAMAATEEYRRWFCRVYGVPRDEIRRAEAVPSDAAGGSGVSSDRGGVGRFKRQPT